MIGRFTQQAEAALADAGVAAAEAALLTAEQQLAAHHAGCSAGCLKGSGTPLHRN
jgi:hypothetical protein